MGKGWSRVSAATFFTLAASCVTPASQRPAVLEAERRLERFEQEHENTIMVPIEHSEFIGPAEQVKAICNARRRKRAEELLAQAARKRKLTASPPYYQGQVEDIKAVGAMGPANAAEGSWSEWKGCLAKYGWKLVSREAAPVVAVEPVDPVPEEISAEVAAGIAKLDRIWDVCWARAQKTSDRMEPQELERIEALAIQLPYLSYERMKREIEHGVSRMKEAMDAASRVCLTEHGGGDIPRDQPE